MAIKRARRGAVSPFIVMDVMEAAAARERSGADVIHMEVGQPSTPAPALVREAAAKAVQRERLGYTVAAGIVPLRQAIADWYGRRYGNPVELDRVFVTTGSSAGFSLAFLSAFEAGDRVAMALPGYPAYRNILTALGLDVVYIQAGLETGYQPTPEHLEAVEGQIDGLIVASPANPTGSMISRAKFERLVRYCEAQGIRLISDEIYHGIEFGETATTAADLSDTAIVINSFSKYFSMTGWRLGWMIVPPDLARSVECLAQNMFISAPSPSQAAALAAFDAGEELDRNVAVYRANRDLLVKELPRVGFPRLAPADGAFYIYADVADRTDDSAAFCRRMLDEVGIAATPGIDFDPIRGRQAVRFSYAGSTQEMAEAISRLADWSG
ncbi:MAG: aminotransferase class I/II-fold pyridoxal phosphate-dependent enzyme [Pseudomonadota bacterium]